MRWFKHALVLLIAAPIGALTLFLLFGKVAEERLCPADAAAVVYVPDIMNTVERALSSGAFRAMVEHGFGGSPFSQVFKDMESLKSQSFVYSVVRALTPEIALVVPTDMDSRASGKIPLLSIVDMGRPMLLMHALGLRHAIKRGQSLGTYSGHPLSSDGQTTTAIVRNLVVLGTDKDVKRAIDVYEGRSPGLDQWPKKVAEARRRVGTSGELYGVVMNSKVIAPSITLGGKIPQSVIPEATFEGGAFTVTLDDLGVKVRAELAAPEGKSVFPYLESGEKAFSLAGYLPPNPRFAMGIRAADLVPLTGSLVQMTRMVGGTVHDETSALRIKMLDYLYSQILAAVGPEILVFSDAENNFAAVLKLRDADSMSKLLKNFSEKSSTALSMEKLTETVKTAAGVEGAIEDLIRKNTLTPAQVRSALPSLTDEEAAKINSLLPDLDAMAQAAHPSVYFIGRTIYYDVKEDTAIFATASDLLTDLMSDTRQSNPSNVDVFFNGPPTGSLFAAYDVKRGIVESMTVGDQAALEESLTGPWALVGQVKDHTGNVTLDAGLLGDLNIVSDRPSGFWLYRGLLWLLSALVLFGGLFSLYVAGRRVERIVNEIRGTEKVPRGASRSAPFMTRLRESVRIRRK